MGGAETGVSAARYCQMAVQDPLVGRKLGHCLVQRKLGAGGMGSVYLARHAGLNKSVAIKVLRRDLAEQPEFITRFVREARLAARLEHPNVVQVFDVGDEGGVHYIAMQFVEGRSLEAVLKERKKLSLTDALSITKRVAVALTAAHRLGIVHRDIKPANVLVSKDGVVKVADFGLAKDEDANRSVSSTGQIMGTPYYMSPEQARGEKADARTDLYSLGATLYHMLTGQRAFEGHTPLSIVVKHVTDDPVPPREIDPSIPEAVCRVLARMMAKRPEDRHASAEELIRDLDAIRTGGQSTKPPAGLSGRRRMPLAFAVAGLLLFGIVVGIVIASGDRSKSGTPPPAAPPPASPVRPAPPPAAPAPSPREKALARLADAQERRLGEELVTRFEAFAAAVKAKESAKLAPFFDRLTFGDLSGEAPREAIARALRDPKFSELDLDRVEVEEVSVRTRVDRAGGPGGIVSAKLYFKHPKSGMEVTLPPTPFAWVRRLDGQWYLTRPPKPGDK